MNIPGIHPSSDDKQIIAAALGAALGALGAYIVGLLVEKRVKRNEGKKEDLRKLQEYSRGITKAEVCCREVLAVLYDADRLLTQCLEKIRAGELVVTLPRQINIGDVSGVDFRNEQLITEWITLRFRIDKLNHFIKEFNDYYTAITREYDRMALRGEGGVAEVVHDNDEILKALAIKVQENTKGVIGETKHMYALVTAHAELSNHEQIKIKSTEQLSKFKVHEGHYKKVRASLEERFRPAARYSSTEPTPPMSQTESAKAPTTSAATS